MCWIYTLICVSPLKSIILKFRCRLDRSANERVIKIGAKCQHSSAQNKEPIKTFVTDINLKKNVSYWMCTRETIQNYLTHRKRDKREYAEEKTSVAKECLIECSSGWCFFCVSFDEWFQWANFFRSAWLHYLIISVLICMDFRNAVIWQSLVTPRLSAWYQWVCCQ